MKRATTEALAERIRRAEAAIVRRDGEFARERDALAAELPRLARRAGVALLVAAAASAGIKLLGRRRHSGRETRRDDAGHASHAPAQRLGGVLTVLSLLAPLVPLLLPPSRSGRRAVPTGGASLPHFARLSWPVLQWWLERPGRSRVKVDAMLDADVAPPRGVHATASPYRASSPAARTPR